jgi:hypothetical protein
MAEELDNLGRTRMQERGYWIGELEKMRVRAVTAEKRISLAREVVWTAATYSTVAALAEDFRRALDGEELS